MSNMILQTKGICKSFGGTKALTDVDFELQRGEIHGLIGENGAGKSTLIKIIAGYYVKDKGEIIVDDEVRTIEKPSDSLELGIRVISQEFNLVNDMSVAENVCIGDYPCYGGVIKGIVNKKQLNERVQQLFDEIGEPIKASAMIKNLSVAEQQTVEIAKALWKQPKILIMDEPTAALNDQETKHLFQLLYRLKQKGVSIIFITHRLQEQFELTDRITVLRDGNRIGTVLTKDITADELTVMMVGKNINANYTRTSSELGDLIFEAKDLNVENVLKDINIKVHRGEIVSIFGLLGQGQDALSRAVIGDLRLDGGEFYIRGEKTVLKSPKDAVRHKMGFVSEDRKKAGLLLLQTVQRNVSIASMKQISKKGVINSRIEKEVVSKWVERLRIKCAGLNQPIVSLSGGNQQKALIARWLANESEFIILNLPTRGVDVGAKYDIYQILEELCESGVGILVFSLELPEVLGISDRIYIMRDGQIVGELKNDEMLNSDMVMMHAVSISEKTQEEVECGDKE